MEADFGGFEISVSVNQSDTIVNKLYTKLCSSPGFPSVNWVAPPLLNHLATTTLHNPTNMLFEKMFHMSQPLAESKARLTSIQSYKRQFLMVTKAMVISSKTVDFNFRGPLGFEARTTLLAVNCDSEDQFAFESASGNIEVMGLVDFTEIRPNCTEITLAIHYRIKNRLFAWLDRHLHFVDTFVNAELRSIRAHFEGIATSYVERMPIVPLFETAAAA
jgi:hypothetical protein